MICDNCGNDQFKPGTSTETFTVNGKLILVEGIPSQFCSRCGTPVFTAEVAEQTRWLVQQPHKPSRAIEAEVVEYRAA